MADPKHLEILKQGVEVWNKWRKENWGIMADLSFVHHDGEDLSNADFRGTSLFGAELCGAILVGANLNGVHLDDALLVDADLSWTFLMGASFNRAFLPGSNFTGATFSKTLFSETDLSEVKGLEFAHHMGPSIIDISTIYWSDGKIPEKFLRGCGVPEDFITYMRSLTGKAIEFYSCFISYSRKDEEFAKRLYADLQNEGVRCWFAPEDMKIGDKISVRIDESIRLYDKLLLVLSENSVSSQWVEKEVETALEKEREQGKIVLFPVRLDDSVLEIKTGWAADVRRSRHIGDFRDWKNHDSYRKAFDRLMRDLKAEANR